MNLISDHYARAVGRLAQEFRDIPEVLAIIKAKARQTQDLEAAAFGLWSALGVSNSYGALLRLYGKLLGVTSIQSDTVLRTFIKAALLLNRSSGTIPEILSIFRLFFPAAVTLALTETKAEFRLAIGNLDLTTNPSFDLSTMTSILHRAKSGGVRAWLDYQGADDAGTFTLDDSTGLTTTTGTGLGDVADSSGGALAGTTIA